MSKPTRFRLAEDLDKAGAPSWMVSRATLGAYDDYKSESATPITDLVRAADAAGLKNIAEAARQGEYDGTVDVRPGRGPPTCPYDNRGGSVPHVLIIALLFLAGCVPAEAAPPKGRVEIELTVVHRRTVIVDIPEDKLGYRWPMGPYLLRMRGIERDSFLKAALIKGKPVRESRSVGGVKPL